jgi:protein-tyrosine-phosphatase
MAVLADDAKPVKARILVLCTGNSARSQMSAGFLKSLDPRLDVYSAGTEPAARVNPFAIQAMKKAGSISRVDIPSPCRSSSASHSTT